MFKAIPCMNGTFVTLAYTNISIKASNSKWQMDWNKSVLFLPFSVQYTPYRVALYYISFMYCAP